MNTVGLIWRDWFTEQLQERAINQFSSVLGLLRRNGILTLVARKWIREEIAGQVPMDDRYLDDIENKLIEYKNDITKGGANNADQDINIILEEKYLNEKLIRQYITNEVLSSNWARKQWSELVPQLYLSNKEQYDIVKASIITVGEKENKLLNEIYHAINNNEYTFEQAFDLYKNKVKGTSNGPSKLKLNEVKPQLKEVIKNCRINKVSKPFKIEGKMAMVKVIEIEEGGLTHGIKNDIIDKQLNDFLDYGVQRLCEFLCG